MITSVLLIDPLNEGVKISKAAIGGIVGGLLFLAVAVLLALCSVKIFGKSRKQKGDVLKYGMFLSFRNIS